MIFENYLTMHLIDIGLSKLSMKTYNYLVSMDSEKAEESWEQTVKSESYNSYNLVGITITKSHQRKGVEEKL